MWIIENPEAEAYRKRKVRKCEMGLSEYIAVVLSLCLVSVSMVSPQGVPGVATPPVISGQCPGGSALRLRACVSNALNITVDIPPRTTSPSCCAILTTLPMLQAQICVGIALNNVTVPGLSVADVTARLLKNCP